MQAIDRSDTRLPFRPLQNRFVLVAAYLLLIAPLWIAYFPPMVDLPQHVAQVHSLKLFLQGDSDYLRLYEINWFTPYLLGYGLIYLCSLLLPLLTATKTVLSASLVAVPELTGALYKTLGVNPVLKWLVLPSLVGFSFYWGFVNFVVATPISIGFLIVAAKFARTASWKNGLGVALFSIFLFFCHVLVLGFMTLIALSMVVGFNFKDIKSLLFKCIPFTAPSPLIVYWLVVNYSLEWQTADSGVFSVSGLERIALLLGQLSGSEHLALVLLLSGTLILFPWMVQGNLTRQPGRWLPFCVAVAVFFAFPLRAFGTSLLYPRLAALIVPLWGLLWDAKNAHKSRWQWLLLITIAVWLGHNMFRADQFRQESAPFQEIVNAMEEDKRVLSLVDAPFSRVYSWPVYLHFPAWYQATQKGKVDFSFAMFFPEILRYKQNEQPSLPIRFAWSPRTLDWQTHRAFDYDYYVVKSSEDISNELFKSHRPKVALMLRRGSWWLYERINATD
jgi:hypothetical protein